MPAPADAAAIGAVHVAAWRSTYPGILPDELSGAAVGGAAGVAIRPGDPRRHRRLCRGGLGAGCAGRIGAARGRVHDRRAGAHAPALAEGEIETLYVLDDWRERGIGRRLMRAAAGHLAVAGCRSAYLWVLNDNPSRWFYTHLGGRAAAHGTVRVAGAPVQQTAYVWDPIEKLIAASPAG